MSQDDRPADATTDTAAGAAPRPSVEESLAKISDDIESLAAAVEGRIVQIAFLGGSKATADFSKLMVKRLVHTGSTLRPRTVEFKGQVAAALEQKVWPLLASRQVAPVMDMIFPLKEAWRAHERMEEGQHIGKIVLDVA